MDKNNEFKVPNAVYKKITTKSKQRVLSEEEYTAVLESIIERDFFPDLSHLRAQNAEEDSIIGGVTPGTSIRDKSPSTFETPERNANSSIRSEIAKRNILRKANDKKAGIIAKGHSLNSFLSSHTSEDNESFQSIINATKLKLEMRLIEMYKLKPLGLTELPKAKDALEAIMSGVDAVRNSTMFIPDGVDLTAAEKIEMSKRILEISHDNTRFIPKPQNENNLISVPAALDKNVNPTQSLSTRMVQTPSPAPGSIGTPFMTWGEIEGTPCRLDPSSTPKLISGPSFHIKEVSKRELLALELAEKAGERMRKNKERVFDSRNGRFTSPFTRKTSDRLASLSPAAKRLTAGKLGLSSIMTPNTRRRLTSPYTPLKPMEDVILRSDKKRPPTSTILPSNDIDSTTLTDNLLNIPRERPKARDFF